MEGLLELPNGKICKRMLEKAYNTVRQALWVILGEESEEFGYTLCALRL